MELGFMAVYIIIRDIVVAQSCIIGIYSTEVAQ